MKKRLIAGFTAAVAVCVMCFGLYLIYRGRAADHTPPVLTVPDTVLDVSVSGNQRELLSDVHAVDDRDGDVDDTIVIESISKMFDDTMAEVTYAAFDRAGNVTKGHRRIRYADYKDPRFLLRSPLIFRENSRFDVFNSVGAWDDIDGDISDRVKGRMLDGVTSMDATGSYCIEFRVTNSLGDTERLTLPVEVVPAGMAVRRPELTDYLIYLKRGDPFEPESYVEGSWLEKLQSITSDVSMDAEGQYQVTYTFGKDLFYDRTRLVVIVED